MDEHNTGRSGSRNEGHPSCETTTDQDHSNKGITCTCSNKLLNSREGYPSEHDVICVCTSGLENLGRQGRKQNTVPISKTRDDDKGGDSGDLGNVTHLSQSELLPRGRNQDALKKSESESCIFGKKSRYRRSTKYLKKYSSLSYLRHGKYGNAIKMPRLPSLSLNDDRLPVGLEAVQEHPGERIGTGNFPSITGPTDFNNNYKPKSLHTKSKDPNKFNYVSPRIRRSDTPDKIANITRRGPRPSTVDIDETARENWILTREIKERFKRFEKIKQKATIILPESDPMETIDARLQEIREMIRPSKNTYNILDTMDEEKKQFVLNLANVDKDQYMTKRRKGWRPIDMFRFAARVVLLVIRCIKNRKRYRVEERTVKPPIGAKTKKSQPAGGKNIPEGRSCLSAEMLLCLTTQPRFRTPSQIRKIRWMLRAAKAFKALFPAEMEAELARMVAYEKYDDGRVIGVQGRAPDRFYYILSGRVNILTQYDLTTGVVTKSLGFMTKSMTSDTEELEKQWLLQANLITKGQVEVLVLDKADFFWLTKANAGPPIDFLRTLELFEEFPCERFLEQKDSIDSKYYTPGKVIVEDSNRTPWLYIVKSGIVKVVRFQSVVDTRTDTRLQTQTTEDLGFGKSFSHADTMLGQLSKQRRMRTMIEEGSFKLPELPVNMSCPNPHAQTLTKHILTSRHIKEHDRVQQQIRTNRRPRHHRDQMKIIQDDEESIPSSTFSSLSVYKDSDEEEQDFRTPRRKRGKREASLPPLLGLNIPLKDTSDDFETHSLWLTREKTKMDAVLSTKKKKVSIQRRTFLQLDELKTGSVFAGRQDDIKQGLDHMHETLASEGQGVSLVSDGAEVIRISKRFFLQHAANNTMLKVETMYKEYMSEKEASDVLYTKETWNKYRSELWSRMTERTKRSLMKRQKTFT